MKKFVIYKFMGSSLFINYSLGIINNFYRFFGVKITNLLIDKTVGSLFISGQSLEQLSEDIDNHKRQNIKSFSNYVAEGLKTMDAEKNQKFYEEVLKSIRVLSEHSEGAMLAVKLTCLVPIDAMTRMSAAQEVYLKDILKYDSKE